MNRAVLDLDSDMEVSQALCQEDRLQLIAEKRKWQTEIENKKRQLEDDRRALQHLKSKALRERWLLDGQEQDEVKRQLEQDEAKTRSLEDTINRLEQELVSLETGSVCQTITHTTVSSGSDKAVEIKGHSSREQERTALSGQVVQAMYSVEIKVERDRLTGETRVLSTNTTLPVDLSHQGVKVYEDEQKVVHEMNGEDGIHLLSSSEVEELIHKADEASMMSQTVATVTSLPTVEVQEEAMPESPPSKPARVAGEITGLEAKPGGEPSVAKASAENPVTMVFMGYQSVEDEAETKKVLGLQGTVTAELVLIDDANGKTSPEGGGKEEASSTAQTAALPPPASPDPPPTTKPPVAIPASNGETAGEVAGEVERGAVEVKKEKQLCKCCSIM
ncbi:paralemmin-1 isoform X4 [Seriola lalandi dorsalis]|uniref:paralemmin-1 isoform X4 n=1 Tax=Seriola lalandi dorsalis TaxID=1841481 RepID=UPI000C6F7ED7|nr:paralemmin-1 isoform X4 [Seriola lalandi dorsalis]